MIFYVKFFPVAFDGFYVILMFLSCVMCMYSRVKSKQIAKE